MRNLYLISILLITIISCKNERQINISSLNSYIKTTDSINVNFSKIYNNTLEGIYKLSDDSIVADSISKLIIIPDTLLFYQFLEYNIAEIEKNYYSMQQEIFFAKDQLIGLKEDVKKKNISPIQYELQLESERKMIELLNERVDSNILIFNNISISLHLKTDSIF